MASPRLADVVRRFGRAYLEQHGGAVLPSHVRALSAIEHCRTPTMGAHLGVCAQCDGRHLLYHSCRHRACPRCGFEQTEQWLARQRVLVLPVPYFHVTFTLPSELRGLVRSHQRALFSVLFRGAYDALAELCADKQGSDKQSANRRRLGGRIGALAVLHTWTRALIYHPHVHMLVPAGALAADGSWRPARQPGRKLYLVSERVLGRLFAGKFLAGARRVLPADTPIPSIKQGINWIVDVRRVEHGPDAVLTYLGRYVHRTAIGDRAVVALDDETVTFRYTDSRTRQRKTMRLPGHEFLQRVLQHVLPRGLHRVRSYGLLHPTHRPTLQRLQLLLGRGVGADVEPDANDDRPRFRCPHCRRGELILTQRLSPEECFALLDALASARGPPQPAHTEVVA